MKVLVTGGAGYIGSTVASACLDGGITPVILDDLSTGRVEFVHSRIFFHGDVADRALVRRIFAGHPDIEAVVHCAARVVVADSVTDPLGYYRANVGKTLDFLSAVLAAGCNRVVFSSSAAIYQASRDLVVDESTSLAPASPYARSKAMVEQILADCTDASLLRAISLRYFNPIGADPRLRSGPNQATPSHVLAKIVEAGWTGRPFYVFGTDWPTRDGSAMRDYIHVWDLARAHVQALRRFDLVLPPSGSQKFLPIDLGTGCGTTVREILTAAQNVLGHPITASDAPRRPGDSVGGYTRSLRSRDLLAWRPELSLEDAVRHHLHWSAHQDDAPTAPSTQPATHLVTR